MCDAVWPAGHIIFPYLVGLMACVPCLYSTITHSHITCFQGRPHQKILEIFIEGLTFHFVDVLVEDVSVRQGLLVVRYIKKNLTQYLCKAFRDVSLLVELIKE